MPERTSAQTWVLTVAVTVALVAIALFVVIQAGIKYDDHQQQKRDRSEERSRNCDDEPSAIRRSICERSR